MVLKIVDTSSYQSNYIPGTVGENGIIVKATEGTTYVNPTCDKQIQMAIKKNMLIGVYHFADLNSTPEAQAQFFYNNCKGYFKSNKCIAVLDYEADSTKATTFIMQFIKKLKDISGAKTIWVYGSNDVVQGAKKSKSPLWFSYYPYASSAVSPATWDAPKFNLLIQYPISLWQFTTSKDKLDRSIFYGDGKAWRKLSVFGN